jgi:hypothetical protein
MKAIPDLEVTETGRREAQSSTPPLAPDQPSLPDPELPLNPPLPDEVDAPQPTEASLPGKKLWKLIDQFNCWKHQSYQFAVIFPIFVRNSGRTQNAEPLYKLEDCSSSPNKTEGVNNHNDT